MEVALALDWKTGELAYNDEKRRFQRWEMQTAARELLDNARLRDCYRARLTDHVRVYRRESTSTYYRGLRVCGLVWACPVCAAKIAERKRLELIEAIDAHSGRVLLLTLTVPHSREDEAFSLTERLLKAFRSFGQGKKAWTGVLPGYVGSVRALEVTHGANGWHPHLHVLVFLGGDVGDLDEHRAALLARWAAVVKRHGLGEVNEHGLKLDGGEKSASYATKWGMEDELTRAHIKQGRKGGRTPWALLADHLEGDKQAGMLFREFAQAFHGKSQLQWSRGLRQRLGLNTEKTDEQLAEQMQEERDTLAARISADDWKIIRRFELRAWVLELLRTATWEAVELLLSHYRSTSPPAEEKLEVAGLGQ